MSKITLDRFWSSSKLLAIHCDTKEKAAMLCKAFHNYGKTWNNEQLYLNNDGWEQYGSAACYANNRRYASIDYYKNNAKIYEFEDVVFDLSELETVTLTRKSYDELQRKAQAVENFHVEVQPEYDYWTLVDDINCIARGEDVRTSIADISTLIGVLRIMATEGALKVTIDKSNILSVVEPYSLHISTTEAVLLRDILGCKIV